MFERVALSRPASLIPDTEYLHYLSTILSGLLPTHFPANYLQNCFIRIAAQSLECVDSASCQELEVYILHYKQLDLPNNASEPLVLS